MTLAVGLTLELATSMASAANIGSGIDREVNACAEALQSAQKRTRFLFIPGGLLHRISDGTQSLRRTTVPQNFAAK
jgi:hypothetical protein